MTSALLLASLVGCSTRRGRADDYFLKGDYERAAEIYADLARKEPADSELVGRRNEARQRAIEKVLSESKALHASGDVNRALQRFDYALTIRDRWSHQLDSKTAQSIVPLTQLAERTIDSEVQAQLKAGNPLHAEGRLYVHRSLLSHSELAQAREALTVATQHAGQKKCGKLAEAAETPYHAWLVSKYCAHYNATLTRVLPLPELRSSLVKETSVVGLSGDDVQRLLKEMDNWFRESVWYSPDGPPAHALIRGECTAQFSVRRVPLTRDWQESIPYTAYEPFEEPYQERYTETETYYEDQTYTDYERRTRSCPTGDCGSESVPVTRHRSVPRERVVTKYRTRYRTVTRPVTRIRYEPRIFEYTAEEHTGRYIADLTMMLDVGPAGTLLTVRVTSQYTQSGFEHDVSFAAAGVRPERPNLLTPRLWFDKQVREVGSRFGRASREHWGQTYCVANDTQMETAARCVYGNPERADSLANAFAAQFGRDATELDTLLAKK